MSKQLTHMKRQVASKMGGRKEHGLTCPHCHGFYTSKSKSNEYFKAKVNKKKLPFSSHDLPPEKGKAPKYAKMSMDRFLKKYPEWDLKNAL